MLLMKQDFRYSFSKNYADIFTITLITPQGESSGPIDSQLGPQTIRYKGTRDFAAVLRKAKSLQPVPGDLLDFLPVGDYLDKRIWRLRLTPRRVVAGDYDLWMPSAGLFNPLHPLFVCQSGHNADHSVYSPAGNFGGSNTIPPARPTQTFGQKDLTATVWLSRIWVSWSWHYRSQPVWRLWHVYRNALCSLLLSQEARRFWLSGEYKWDDPFLYGEKIKAYLQRGAKQLPGYETWPNPNSGVRDAVRKRQHSNFIFII